MVLGAMVLGAMVVGAMVVAAVFESEPHAARARTAATHATAIERVFMNCLLGGRTTLGSGRYLSFGATPSPDG
jgi:hypothetical protein